MNRSVEGADRRKLIPLSDCKPVAQASKLNERFLIAPLLDFY